MTKLMGKRIIQPSKKAKTGRSRRAADLREGTEGESPCDAALKVGPEQWPRKHGAE